MPPCDSPNLASPSGHSSTTRYAGLLVVLATLLALAVPVAGWVTSSASAEDTATTKPSGPGLGLVDDEQVGLFAARGGPDVSGHNHPNGASIDWARVKAAGNDFAFVKATEGTSFRNTYFTADWPAVAAAGMYRGAYHYARPNLPLSDAVSEANAFLDYVGPTSAPGMLPPVLDLEEAGGLGTTDLVAWAQTWLSTVESKTGRTPIIYTYPYFWKTAMGNTDAFTSYPLWIADYNGGSAPRTPLVGAWKSWTFWQFTSTDNISGISGIVDNNRYCCGSSLAALALDGDGVRGTPTPAPTPTPAELAAPTAVTVTAADSAATVSWTAPAGTVDSYTVTPYLRGTDKQAPTTVSGKATTATITGLANGSSYTFTVAGVNAAGSGAESKPTGAVTPYGPTSAFTVPPGPDASPEHPLIGGARTTDGSSLSVEVTQGDPAPATYRSTLVALKVTSTAPVGAPLDGGAVDVAVDGSVLPVGALGEDVTLARNGVPVAATCGQAAPPAQGCLRARTYDGHQLRLSVLTADNPAATWTVVSSLVGRVFGDDRMQTAVAVSQASFPAGQAKAVVLARADSFADALAGAPLATARSAPLLLTLPQALLPNVADEVRRVLPTGGRVFLLGGENALSPDVAGALRGSGYAVTRLFGADRYATAAAVADEVVAQTGAKGAYLARGDDFADSLAAGTAAAAQGRPLLLTLGAALPTATTRWLTAHPGDVTAVGGPASRAAPQGAVTLAGADRYATATAVADRVFPKPVSAGLASGVSFPDALSVGPALARVGAPLLLSDPRVLPGATRDHLVASRATLDSLHLYGGRAALSTAVEQAIQQALRG